MWPPDDALLGGPSSAVGPALDLGVRGRDMPPEPHERLARRFGVPPARVALTLGTSHALYLACATLLTPGARCLVESPAYEVLHGLPALLGAEVSRFERRFEDGYRLPQELAAIVARERPALVIVSNPHNPTGALLTLDELEPLAQAVAAVSGSLFVDEVYLEFLADAPRHSAHQLGSQVLVASSLTKAFGLGTLRFGWLVASEERIAAALRLNDYIAVHYPGPAAALGLRALEHLPALQARTLAVREHNLGIVEAFLATRPELSWQRPGAGTIVFPRLALLDDTEAWCQELVRRHETLVVPGAFFGAPQHLRLGFAVEEQMLRDGLVRLGTALDELARG
jgi:aspartate/methionine/tyrosine aminotransferase